MGDDNQKFQAKLPAKISGIVFWGLVFVGLLVAVFLLEKAESELYSIHKSNVRLIAYELEKVLEADASGGGLSQNNPRLKNTINQLRSEMGFTSIQLDSDTDSLKLGGENPDDDVYPFTFYYYSKLVSTIIPVNLRVYYPDQKAEIADIRKNMLLMIGSSVIVFGLLLQQILQKLLSAPFMNMVNVARQFSEGRETVRFDQARQDEFGYLGRFINNAIDSLMLNQEGLVEALERAFDSEMELNAEKERVEVTLQSITESVITVNTLERIEYINPAAESLLGIDLEAALGRKFTDIVSIVSDNKDDEITSPIHECFNNGNIIKLPEHSSLINGEASLVAIEATIAPMKNDSGEIIGAVMVIQDVSHTRRLTRQLSYQASHDMLTGLFNRRKFEEHLEEILQNVIPENRLHSLCYLDLDQFKVVNDTCGHIAGDELLQQLPGLFNSVLRTGDVIARLGGDEFGILLENCGITKASSIAETLRQTIKDFRFIWRDKSFEIGVSIGVVAITPDNCDKATIMSSADLACYAAKDGGRNRVHIYEVSDEAVSIRYGEMHWTARITKAMEEQRMRLYRQPIIGIAGDQASHSEILLRMLDEDGSIIPPGAFLPAAERYNLIAGIDRWVISEVFKLIARETAAAPAGSQPLMVSINLSGDSLCDDNLLDYIISERTRNNISLSNVCFEITETVAISNMFKATIFMNQLRNHGCRFALDDFGSGLSSFAYLKTLPVNYLKIDGAFVRNISRDKIDRAMVNSIQQVGAVMNLRTVAECVEDEATLGVLIDIGVDFVQGYHLGRPEPIDPV